MVSEGVLQLNLNLQVPTIFGVLTVNNEAQALENWRQPRPHQGEKLPSAH